MRPEIRGLAGAMKRATARDSARRGTGRYEGVVTRVDPLLVEVLGVDGDLDEDDISIGGALQAALAAGGLEVGDTLILVETDAHDYVAVEMLSDTPLEGVTGPTGATGATGATGPAGTMYVDITRAPYNAVAGADCTQALIDACATNRRVFVPEGEFFTTVAPESTRGMFGESDAVSIVTQNTAAQPVAIARGEGNHWHDLRLQHASLPTGQTVPNGVGIRLRNVGDRSVFERLRVVNSTVGVYCKEAVSPDATNYVFSTRFSDMRLSRFTRGAMELSAAGAGNTGCVVSNIYAENWDTYPTTKLTAVFGFTFANFDELEAEQLNVEWGIYSRALDVNSCRNFALNGLHVEGFEANSSFAGMIHVLGSNTKVVELSGISLNEVTIDTARSTDYGLLRVDDAPVVLVNRLQTVGTVKVGTPTLRRFYSPSATSGCKVYADAWSLDVAWPNSNDFFAVANVLRRNPQEEERFARVTIDAGALVLTAMSAGSAPPNSVFLDIADNIMKQKNNAGTVTAL